MGAEEQQATTIDTLLRDAGFSLASQTFVKTDAFDAFKRTIPAPEAGTQTVYFLQPSGNGYEISTYTKGEQK